ncbi:hydroxymethylbilane synthase [Marisediminicola antarctica]|uniref:Porphobilinogen deaminase n=2 Tax=Marisediminicola antarctica TaxID=674079 RepID=A0A7L5AJW4_9MICO|nr:hydroxymethylbilane synthase [Marisediminicola antarctica]
MQTDRRGAAAVTVELIRLGTRASALAMAQSQTVADSLAKASGLPVELVPITTEGDRSKQSLSTLGGTGVFAIGLREALRDGRCDVVVHSLKDLPTAPAEGLMIAGIPKRADARDAVCARDGMTLDTLPPGATVGTGSPRRAAQLRRRRPDLEVVDIRGNVDTRLGKVASGDLDAVMLAAAGLARLGRLEAVTEFCTLDGWPTAPGQGALAIETVAKPDRVVRSAVASIEHRPTRLTVTAEREVLRILEAGCAAPIGAHALLDDGLIFLSARVYSPDGTEHITSAHALYLDDDPRPAETVAAHVARELLSLGAGELVPAGSIS